MRADGTVTGCWHRVRTLGLGLLGSAALGGAMLPLSGCNNFFQCENKPACPATTTTTTGTSSSVDYAYVAYTTATTSTTTTSTLVGYNLAGGALTQVANVTLPFIPVAIAVSPNNEYLYVASTPGTTNGGVFGYAISSTGNLTALSSGAALAGDQVAAMAISPDGDYLYTVNVLGQTMVQYSIASAGTLTTNGAGTVPALNCALGTAVPVTQSCSVAVSPTKAYVVTALGTAGDAVYGYVSGSGLTNNGVPIGQVAAGTDSGEFSVAIDGNNNAYVAETAGLTAYALTSSTPTLRLTVPYASGAIPRGVVVDPGSKFVFTANEGTNNISAFTTGTTTALTAVSGSPFAAPNEVAALGVDSTDTYLVAAGYDASAGIQLYSIASSGVLSALAKTAGTTTATQYPVLVAMSH
jgi:6-phosphogluconolactonase